MLMGFWIFIEARCIVYHSLYCLMRYKTMFINHLRYFAHIRPG